METEKYGAIPFVAGDFVHEWKNKNRHICEPIVNEILRVVKNNNFCAFVQTDELLSNNQKLNNGDIHFCRESLYELGHKYFKAFFEIHKHCKENNKRFV